MTEDFARRFWERVDRSDLRGCWTWSGCVASSGYGVVKLGVRSSPVVGTHRVAYELTYGAPEGFVCHTCDNRLCCNPGHLFVGSHIDNMRDMHRKGRHALAGGVPITDDLVERVRAMSRAGVSLRKISRTLRIGRARLERYVCPKS